MRLPKPAKPGELEVHVPLASDLAAAVRVAGLAAREAGRRQPRFFLRLSDGVTTNYSEPFDISPSVVFKTGGFGNMSYSQGVVQGRLTWWATNQTMFMSHQGRGGVYRSCR